MSAIRVELQLEDGSFTSRMLHAGQSVRQLQNEIGQGVVSIRSMERESSSFLRTLGAVTLGIGAAAAALSIMKGTANGLVGDLVRVNAEFERMNQVLRGMSTAADPIKDAANQVKFLREFATQAPFSLRGLTDVFVRMKATGIDPMAGAMRSLVDAVAASGGTEQQLGRAALAISQMSGKGVIQMEELRQQLGEAIPRATELMARSMGVTYADLVQKISTGMVSAKPALEALNLEFQRVFGGAAQAQMNTFNGLINQTKTQFQNLALAAGEAGFMDAIKTQVRDLNNFLTSGSANALAQSIGSGMGQVVTSIRGAIDWVVKFRNEIATMGEMLAYVFGGALAISGVSRLLTGFQLLTANVATLGGALAAFTPAALAAANAQRAVAIAAGGAAVGTGAFTSAVGMLGFAMSRLLPQLAVIGIVASGVIAFFDLFGSSAKKADESMRTFGATSQEELQRFSQATEAMRQELEKRESSLNYWQKRQQNYHVFANPKRLKEEAAEVEKIRNEILNRDLLLGQRKDEFNTNTNERAAQAELRQLADREQRIRREYDIKATQRAKEREEAEKDAVRVGKSVDQVRQQAQQRERASQVQFYDDIAKIYEEAMVGAEQRIKDARDANEKDVAERARGAMASQLVEINKNKEAARAAAIGVSMSPKVTDETKLIEKGNTQLERLKASIVELRAELNGASGESAKLAYELEKIKFKDGLDNPAIARLIEQIKSAQSEYEKLDKLMNGQKKLSEALDAELKKIRDERFELENSGASAADKMLARVRRGDFEGWTVDENGSIVRTAEAMATFEKLATNPEAKKNLEGISGAIAEQKTNLDRANEAARSAVQTITNGFNSGRSAVDTFNSALARTVGIVEQIKSGVTGINLGSALSGGSFPGLTGSGVLPGGQSWTSGGDFGKFINKLTGVESGNNPNAKNGNSSATGLGQFISGTWLQFMREVMPEALRERSTAEVLAMRNDPGLSRQATEWYARKNASALEMGGFQPTDANLYLSHFLGPAGALKTLRADPNASIRDIVGDDAYNANRRKDGGFVYGETAGAVIAEITRRFGNAVSIKGQAGSQTLENPIVAKYQAPSAVEAIRAQTLAIRDESKATEELNKKRSDIVTETAKLQDSKLTEYVRSIGVDAKNTADQLDGAGKRVADFRTKVRNGEFGRGNGLDDPDSERYAKVIEQLAQIDEGERRLSDARKRRTASENAVKQNDAAVREAERKDEITRRRLGNLTGPDPADEQSASLKRALEERLKAIEDYAGKESQAYKDAAAQNKQILDSEANARASKRAAELAQDNQTTARSLMNTTQANQAKLREEIATLQAELQNTQATGNARVAIEQQIAEKIRLLRQQASASGPMAQAAQQWGDIGRNMETAMVGWVDGGIDAIAEFVATGEMNFKKLLQSIVKDVTKMGLRYMMSQVMGGKGGAGGAGGKAGKAGAAAPRATGKAATGGKGAFHTGGIIGGMPPMIRNVSPAVFAGAPRFHTGGIIGALGGLQPGEVPIIAKEGEGVFTPEQMAAMGGRSTAISQNVTVNVAGGSSGDTKNDQKLADMIGRRVQDELRGMVGQEIKQQLRPGGIIREAGRN